MKGPWIKVDAAFFGHPKVVTAGRDARDLFLAGLCWAGAYLTDGFIPAPMLTRLAADACVPDAEECARRLIAVGLWEKAPAGFRIHDYLQHQTSREKARTISRRRAAAGMEGGRPPRPQAPLADELPAEADGVRTEKQNESKPEANDVADAKQNGSNAPAELKNVRTEERKVVNAPLTPHVDDGGSDSARATELPPSRSSLRSVPKPRDVTRAHPLFAVLEQRVERPVSDDDWKRLDADLKEFTALGATPEEVERRAANYPLLMGADRTGHRPVLSRRALLKWWPQCDSPPEPAPSALPHAGRPTSDQIIDEGLRQFAETIGATYDAGFAGRGDAGVVYDVAPAGAIAGNGARPVGYLRGGAG